MQVSLPQPTTPTQGFQKGDRRGAEAWELDPPNFSDQDGIASRGLKRLV